MLAGGSPGCDEQWRGWLLAWVRVTGAVEFYKSSFQQASGVRCQRPLRERAQVWAGIGPTEKVPPPQEHSVCAQPLDPSLSQWG